MNGVWESKFAEAFNVPLMPVLEEYSDEQKHERESAANGSFLSDGDGKSAGSDESG